MQRLEIGRLPKNRVMALFEGSAISFDMAPATSLLDLAERLSGLGGRHDGALISVTVRVDSKNEEFRLIGRGRDQKRDRR
jgi:hypothetical protein